MQNTHHTHMFRGADSPYSYSSDSLKGPPYEFSPVPLLPGGHRGHQELEDEKYGHEIRQRPSVNKRKRRNWIIAGVLVGAVVVGAGVGLGVHFAKANTTTAGGTSSAESQSSTSSSSNSQGSSSSSSKAPSSSSAAVAATASNTSPYANAALYYPQGYNGTHMNGAVGGRKGGNVTYDQLLVFGSSYSDNGHYRDSQYYGSYPPDNYWNKRWSDGPVWVEYLRDLLGNWTHSANGKTVQHLNYAYGGATTNNSIHNTNVPDTNDQMQFYLTSSDYQPSTKKPLVALFTTTNDIQATFAQWADSSSWVYQDRDSAMDVITQSANSLINQLLGLIPARTSYKAPDYLILPILPVELTPQGLGAASDAGYSPTMIRDLTRQYNAVLMQGAQTLANRLGTRGTVFTYDTMSLFYNMVAKPSLYSLTNVKDSCYATACSNGGAGWIFWDRLHLVTSMQSRLANIAYNVILTST